MVTPIASRFSFEVAPDRPVLRKHLVRDNLLAADQVDLHAGATAAIVNQLHAIDFLAQAHGDPPLAQMVRQRLDDFGVDEGQQARGLLDDRHPNPERGEDTRILASDNAGADDRQRCREILELQDVVAGKNAIAVQRHPRIARRLGADCDQNLIGGDCSGAGIFLERQLQRVRIDKGCLGMLQLDAVAKELMAGDVDFVAHHRFDAKKQIRQRDLFFNLVRFAIEGVLAITGKVKNRLAHSLAGDGSDVHAYAADDGFAFDHQHPLAQLGGLNRR